jgi:hypothetical protein
LIVSGTCTAHSDVEMKDKLSTAYLKFVQIRSPRALALKSQSRFQLGYKVMKGAEYIVSL